MTKSYKERVSVENRIKDSNRIVSKYPTHIPVIVEIDEKIGKIKKNKFLVPFDVTASYLMISIRFQIQCKKEEALFMFSDNTLVCQTMIIGNIYQNYMDKKKLDKNKIV